MQPARSNLDILRLRWLWLAIGWGLLMTIVALSLGQARDIDPFTFQNMDKVKHIVAYSALMGWFVQIYHRLHIRLIYAASFILMGIVLEILQGIGGHRQFEINDMVANAIGVCIGLLHAFSPWWVPQWVEQRFLHR